MHYVVALFGPRANVDLSFITKFESTVTDFTRVRDAIEELRDKAMKTRFYFVDKKLKSARSVNAKPWLYEFGWSDANLKAKLGSFKLSNKNKRTFCRLTDKKVPCIRLGQDENENIVEKTSQQIHEEMIISGSGLGAGVDDKGRSYIYDGEAFMGLLVFSDKSFQAKGVITGKRVMKCLRNVSCLRYGDKFRIKIVNPNARTPKLMNAYLNENGNLPEECQGGVGTLFHENTSLSQETRDEIVSVIEDDLRNESLDPEDWHWGCLIEIVEGGNRTDRVQQMCKGLKSEYEIKSDNVYMLAFPGVHVSNSIRTKIRGRRPEPLSTTLHFPNYACVCQSFSYPFGETVEFRKTPHTSVKLDMGNPDIKIYVKCSHMDPYFLVSSLYQYNPDHKPAVFRCVHPNKHEKDDMIVSSSHVMTLKNTSTLKDVVFSMDITPQLSDPNHGKDRQINMPANRLPSGTVFGSSNANAGGEGLLRKKAKKSKPGLIQDFLVEDAFSFSPGASFLCPLNIHSAITTTGTDVVLNGGDTRGVRFNDMSWLMHRNASGSSLLKAYYLWNEDEDEADFLKRIDQVVSYMPLLRDVGGGMYHRYGLNDIQIKSNRTIRPLANTLGYNSASLQNMQVRNPFGILETDTTRPRMRWQYSMRSDLGICSSDQVFDNEIEINPETNNKTETPIGVNFPVPEIASWYPIKQSISLTFDHAYNIHYKPLKPGDMTIDEKLGIFHWGELNKLHPHSSITGWGEYTKIGGATICPSNRFLGFADCQPWVSGGGMIGGKYFEDNSKQTIAYEKNYQLDTPLTIDETMYSCRKLIPYVLTENVDYNYITPRPHQMIVCNGSNVNNPTLFDDFPERGERRFRRIHKEGGNFFSIGDEAVSEVLTLSALSMGSLISIPKDFASVAIEDYTKNGVYSDNHSCDTYAMGEKVGYMVGSNWSQAEKAEIIRVYHDAFADYQLQCKGHVRFAYARNIRPWNQIEAMSRVPTGPIPTGPMVIDKENGDYDYEEILDIKNWISKISPLDKDDTINPCYKMEQFFTEKKSSGGEGTYYTREKGRSSSFTPLVDGVWGGQPYMCFERVWEDEDEYEDDHGGTCGPDKDDCKVLGIPLNPIYGCREGGEYEEEACEISKVFLFVMGVVLVYSCLRLCERWRDSP